jgi:S-(hydroxymethyl)glutathione dehydrogenase/alcohol dehydrogenase
MRSKAALAMSPGSPLVVDTIDVSGPKAGECLVEVRAAGVCGSDALFLSGRDPEKFPCVPGHEAAGVVIDVGTDVRAIRVGDRVLALHKPECGHCDWCQNRKTNLCQTNRAQKLAGFMADWTTRFSWNGTRVYHCMGVSGYSQLTVIHENGLCALPDDLPFAAAATVGCAVGTGYGAVKRCADVEPGSSVLVIVLGGVGLSVAQTARHMRASPIMGIDMNASKRSLAGSFGVDEFIEWSLDNTEIIERVRRATQGGADYVFECTGKRACIDLAIHSSHPAWGTVILVGLGGRQDHCSFHPDAVAGRTIRGTTFGHMKGKTDLPEIFHLHAKGELDLTKLVARVSPLESINDAFTSLSIEHGRVIMEPWS